MSEIEKEQEMPERPEPPRSMTRAEFDEEMAVRDSQFRTYRDAVDRELGGMMTTIIGIGDTLVKGSQDIAKAVSSMQESHLKVIRQVTALDADMGAIMERHRDHTDDPDAHDHREAS